MEPLHIWLPILSVAEAEVSLSMDELTPVARHTLYVLYLSKTPEQPEISWSYKFK